MDRDIVVTIDDVDTKFNVSLADDGWLIYQPVTEQGAGIQLRVATPDEMTLFGEEAGTNEPLSDEAIEEIESRCSRRD